MSGDCLKLCINIGIIVPYGLRLSPVIFLSFNMSFSIASLIEKSFYIPHLMKSFQLSKRANQNLTRQI